MYSLALTFRSLIHFELILYMIWNRDPKLGYTFASNHSVVPASSVERLFFSPLNGLGTLDKNPLSIDDITHVCTPDSKKKKRRKKGTSTVFQGDFLRLPTQSTSISLDRTGSTAVHFCRGDWGMWSLLQLLELTANFTFSFIYCIY